MNEAPIRRRGPAVRARILQAAKRLFEAQGISATGMEQIAATAPVSKGTLYAQFSSKDELVVEYLRYLVDAGLTVDALLDNDDVPPRDRLLALFAPAPETGQPLRGCPFIDAAVEYPNPQHPVHAFATEQKRRFGRRLADLAREAGAVDADFVGEQLALLSDGLASHAMVLDDATSSQHARAIAELLLDAAIHPSRELAAAPRGG